jgi:adenylate cyclase
MEPAPELVQLMERVLRSWAVRDHQSVIDAFSRHSGALVIGTDPDEWWVGAREFGAVLQIQWQETPPFDFDVHEIVGWREGTVGWIAARFDLNFEGRPPVPIRSTAVFHEEGTYWRMVQWQNSVAVANEEIVGMGLTTTVDDILQDVQDERPSVSAMAPDGSVTIVFTDIEGSTNLMETIGEKRWLELLAWHNDAVTQQTALFGGTVVKGQGDGFMLAFPACGSALACAVVLERLLRAGWEGTAVPTRMGIHCGNAKAESGDFFGRTVVIAARISGAAAGGEILVSDDVARSLAGAFGLDASRSIAMKGISGHQSVFPVRWQ